MSFGVGYENAPATRMLATHCAVCRRPLVDALSVDVGIGPDCRKKYGFNRECEPGVREEANRIVHAIALAQTGLSVATDCERLFELGFPKLAEVVWKRVCPVRISVEGNLLVVHTPYSEAATDAFRRVNGRRWHGKDCVCERCMGGAAKKVNTFPLSSRRELSDALNRVFRGVVAMGPKGPFVIGGAP